jgi:hypothetical protein
LYGLFLSPVSAAAPQPLRTASPSHWRALCGRSYEWVEIIPRN